MTERRPHWDDELIFAVMSAAGDGGHLFIDDIHAVIAAVEDWEKETFNAATEVLVERIQKAEAQVQAVRDAIEAELERVISEKGIFGDRMKHQDCYMFYEDRAHTCSEIDALRDEIETLRAQIQAVRDVCKTYHLDDSYPNRRKVVFLDRILRALDGADRA